jgi:hypothetical protein
MITRRFFSRLPVVGAAAAAVASAAPPELEPQALRQPLAQSGNSGIVGSWNTIMTFDGAPPAPIPKSFWILETFFAEGSYVSMAGLPYTTSAHGNWSSTGGGQIKTRSRLLVLPSLLGVNIKVEITEAITIDSGGDNYSGTFSAVFAPDGATPFTLTGVPTGGRIPPA